MAVRQPPITALVVYVIAAILTPRVATEVHYSYRGHVEQVSSTPAQCYERCRAFCEYVCKDAMLTDLTFLKSVQRRKKPWTELDLSYNRLTAIEKGEISHTVFRDLEELYLEHNELSTIDDDAIIGFPHLVELYLTGNKLTRLSKYSFRSSSLETLLLDDCGIDELPDGILKQIPRLTILNLDNNELIELERGTFRSLKRLQEIHVAGNNLTELDSDVFAGLANLKRINFTRNSITTLSGAIFRNLTRLEDIQFAYNSIAYLDADTFLGLDGLLEINFSNNFLTAISEGLFASPRNLRIIHFDGNNLTSLNLHTFGDLIANSNDESLQVGTKYTLTLTKNPWNCQGCDLYKVFKWLRQNTTMDYHFHWSPMICQTPDRFRGKSWTFVPWDDTESDCIELPTTTLSTTTETTEVPTTTHSTVTTTTEEMPKVSEATTMETEVSTLTKTSEKLVTMNATDGPMAYIKENSNLCIFQYYFLGSYACVVLFVACGVWVIIYKEKLAEMKERQLE